MNWFLSCALAIGAIFLCTMIHYEAIRVLDNRLKQSSSALRRNVPAAVTAIMTAHLIEIGIYAFALAIAAGPFHLGAIPGTGGDHALQVIAFAAEAYTSFGYGDVIPTGGVRLIASIAPLNGLLLLAWSGAFLYAAVHQRPSGG